MPTFYQVRGAALAIALCIAGGAAGAHLVDQRQQRAAERHEVAQQMPPQQRQRHFEEGFGGDIGVGDLAVGGDDDNRMRQRVEHRVRRRAHKQGCR